MRWRQGIGRRVLLAAVLMAGMGPLLGQTAEQSPEEIATQLASKDAAVRAAALATIRSRIEEKPWQGASAIRSTWLKPLVEGGHLQEAIALCVEGICAAPEQTWNVEYLQQRRVELLRVTGQHAEALAQAKALFNMVSMPGSSFALLTVAECGNEAFGNDAPFVEHLVAEERAGMKAPAGDGGGVVSPTMKGIRVDASVYAEALRRFRLPSGELPIAPADLVAVGNLSLLADDGKTALAAFEKLAEMGPPQQARVAREGIARALRAEDGTVGRANRFLAQ